MKTILAVALGIAIAFLLAVGFPSHGAGQATGQMRNCPAAGKWSIAVWDGPSGTAAADALATCGAGAVDAAYSLDPETGAWSRWFADKPDFSSLPPLNNLQAVIALGSGTASGSGPSPGPGAQPGQMQNCPAAAKWSIAVWDGDSGATAADALASCGTDAVAAAYSLDAQTQAWSRWFADKPEVSNLAPLNDKQGVLALGAGGEAPPPPAGPEAELAAQLYAAADSDAAAIPMLQIYDYLGAGLYTVDGQPIQAGAETGPDDFRLYDVESDLMLQAYIERKQFTVEDLAIVLGQGGVANQETGQPFTGSEWLAMLAEAVSRARQQDWAFTVRLIDALGLVRSTPLDLTAPGLDPATTYLDPVQTFLILYDVLFGLPAETGAASADGAAGPDTVALAGGGRTFGQILIILTGGPVGVSIGMNIEIIHELPKSWFYKITLEEPKEETHWFPCEGSRDVTLKAKAVWDAGKFNEAVRQANLYGIDWFPVPGAQDDMRVTWTAEEKLVPKSGSWKGTSDTEVTQLTDANGEASITFVPKTERRPGEGSEKVGGGLYRAQLRLRSWPSQFYTIPMDWGGGTHGASGSVIVVRHQNWTVEIEGSVSDIEALGWPSWAVTFPKTSIPLRKAEKPSPAGWELDGEATVEMDASAIIEGIQTRVPSPPQVDVWVHTTGQNPITFYVGVGPTQMVYESLAAGGWTSSAPNHNLTITAVFQCSLPAEDGASTSCPLDPLSFGQIPGFSGSLTLTLREE
jgi:hypothetical protein